MSKRYVRFIDPGIIVQPAGSKGGDPSGTSSYAETASFAHTASYALEALSASYAISASHEIVKEVSSSYADTASFALTASYAENVQNIFTPISSLIARADRNIEITGSLKTTKPITTSGNVYIKHNGAFVSNGTAALFLGTTHQGMDLARLNDSSLVLGGVTQEYGWRIFGIKHGLNGSTYTTEIDNLIATGSMKISGSLDISLESGSAFTVTETDKDQKSRLDFFFDDGDPTLEIEGRSAVAKIVLSNNDGVSNNIKIQSDG